MRLEWANIARWCTLIWGVRRWMNINQELKEAKELWVLRTNRHLFGILSIDTDLLLSCFLRCSENLPKIWRKLEKWWNPLVFPFLQLRFMFLIWRPPKYGSEFYLKFFNFTWKIRSFVIKCICSFSGLSSINS